jgi:hypothetical protein
VGTPARGKEIFFAGAKGFFATKVHEGTVGWGHPPGGSIHSTFSPAQMQVRLFTS